MTGSLSGPAFELPAGVSGSLAAFIRARVEENPDGRCIEIDQAGGRISTTLRELQHRTLRILHALQAATTGDSDIVLCFESALDFVPAAWACIYGGYSCLAWHVTGGPGDDQQIKSRLDAIRQKLDQPILLSTDAIKRRIADRGESPFRKTISIDVLLDQSEALSPPASRDGGSQRSADDGSFLIWTSGTTAAPKFAVVGNRCLLNRFLALQEHRSSHARVFCFPFDGISGMLIMYPALADRIYLQPGRLAAQPLELLKLAEEFRLKGFGVSSSLLARILDAAEGLSDPPDLSSLEHIGLGAEMIVPDIVRRLGVQSRRMSAPDLKVWFAYGMTETAGICWTEKLGIDRAIASIADSSEPFSVGPCVTGWSLRIVDDAGKPVAAGAPGNIEVWSETQLFSGYKNDLDLNAQSFTEDGWFRTGDIGIIRNGALTIAGRQKATIAVNAKKISLEWIEAPLRQMEGIRRSLAAAAAVRRADSPTDELAVFFVPRDDGDTAVDELCRRISHEVSRHSGVPAKHIVPVGEANFPLTATGKVRRDELVRLYQSGVLTAHVPARLEEKDSGRRLNDRERWLTELWRKVLKLDSAPSSDASFLELGGDSLASAEMIFAVEEKFSCEVPIQTFFRKPTIATLAKLLEQTETIPRSNPVAGSADGSCRLVHRLRIATGGWPGERLFADSLIVGHNTGGRRTPIFLVCQAPEEFLQAAKHLGPDQPIYAMRSCSGIVSIKDHSAEVIETVCSRYLWEMLALPVKAPFFVGGFCQAGILALGLARRLKQINRTPTQLILIEWTYTYGRYSGPTLLLYGEKSYTADIYLKPESHEPNWREDFPNRTVASTPGTHGTITMDENISGFADVIRRHVSPARPGPRYLRFPRFKR